MVDTRIVWFRRDLRLADHPALAAALDGDDVRVVLLFVLDDVLLASDRVGPPRLAYLADALADLDANLRARDARLVIRRGHPRDVLPALAAEVRATAVHRSAEHAPYGRSRDARVDAVLDIPVHDHPGVLVHPPGDVRTGSGTVFKVFTPFHRTWRDLAVDDPLAAPDHIPVHGTVASDDLPSRADLAGDLDADIIPGGESHARARLDAFLTDRAHDYATARDALHLDGTSRISADLHYGCLSPREVLARLDRRSKGHDAFATELAWREFYGHVMSEWPEVRTTEFNADYRGLPWSDDADDLATWAEGRTGFPVVDAGMRQLARTGWMHNRARMITASFLCKDLLVDWRLGEAHFLTHLVDADMASNNGGWQWAAGTGTDAQPYFRIFNPTSQGRRFDPDGDYVRRWVPELAEVPARRIHEPWTMSDAEQAEARCVIGTDYPGPMVDHADARARALDWFTSHKR